ncbi:MAG: hypothetical protein CFE24_11725 [Flavobacterium sp. BFFFF2]|nr:MAG: hypothetical protein CFE24_11725 [Flavobacterium sp. BFFFF2]
MKVKLQSGKEVVVEAFHFTATYSGLIVGAPTVQSNEKMIQHLTYPREWGNRPCILKKADMYSEVKNQLKPLVYSVWLSSGEPIDDLENQFDGCALVVMWFGQHQPHKSIYDIIVEGVKNVDWNEFAGNYQL